MVKKMNFKCISEFQLPEESPGYLLWRVSLKWRSLVEKTLKNYDLTHPQFVVMAALAWLTKDGIKVNQIEVGRMSGLDPNTTSQVIRGLEKKNMIKRTQSVDERSKNPTVTDLGQKTLHRALPAVEAVDIAFFAVLEDSEKNQLISSFNKLTMQS